MALHVMRASYAMILLLLAGCASSLPVQVDYDAASGMSTYASSRTLVGHRDMSGGLAGGQRVMWQARASCSGEGCTPEEIQLAFFNDSNSDLNLDYRRLQVIFDGTSREWEDLSQPVELQAYAVPRGEFIQVPLKSADFARMATAREVEVVFGRSGTSVFSVPYERRTSFRALAEAMGL